MIGRRGALRAFATAVSVPLLARLGIRVGRAGDEPFRAPLPPGDRPIERLAFGSCNDQRLSQDFWEGILAVDPQLLLLIGDNVYGDVSGPELTELREAYARLAAEPGFRRVTAEVPTLAIWDDHDYGANDAGGEFPWREQSTALFREFWRVPASSRRATGDGLYDAWTFGPEGRRLQIILLDTRSFRSPLLPTDARNAPGRERYLPDPKPEKTMLGEAQWDWLVARLREPADLRLLVSSIQILPESHGWERWGNLPLERERLIGLIGETRAGGVVILSGDRHFGAAYRRTHDVSYPLTELTASSFNRPFREAAEQDAVQVGGLFTEGNFGLVRIDWEAGQLALELHWADGSLERSVSIPFGELAV